MTTYKDKYIYVGTVSLTGGGLTSRVLQSPDGTNWDTAEAITLNTVPAGILSLGIMGDSSYLLAGTYSPNGAELWMKEIVVPIVTLPATGQNPVKQNRSLIYIVSALAILFLSLYLCLALRRKSWKL